MLLDLEQWEIIGKTIGGLAAAALAIYRFAHTRIGVRSSLRSDLQLLKSLGRDDPNYALIKATVDDKIQRLYGKQRRFDREFVGNLVFALLMFIGFGTWTAYLVTRGHWAWSILTGMFALSGLPAVVDPEFLGSRETRPKTRRPSATVE